MKRKRAFHARLSIVALCLLTSCATTPRTTTQTESSADEKAPAGKWELSGVGGDNAVHTARCNASGKLSPTEVYDWNGKSFVHFTLNDKAWPDEDWGVAQDTWCFACENGASLSGTGGDGQTYTAEWTGKGKLLQRAIYELQGKTFIHFSLNGEPWPDQEWGIEQGSWSITCK
jgi:hypothetical protein